MYDGWPAMANCDIRNSMVISLVYYTGVGPTWFDQWDETAGDRLRLLAEGRLSAGTRGRMLPAVPRTTGTATIRGSRPSDFDSRIPTSAEAAMRAHRLQTAPICTDLLAFGTGDDVIPILERFLRDEGIRAGRVGPGIGAFSSAVLAFFDPDDVRYHEFEIQGPVEVMSLSGNVATLDGEPRLHLHATVSRRDGSCVGGHLVSARVQPTLELFITRYDRALVRKVDSETGLPLLDRG